MHFLRLPNGLWFLLPGAGSEIQKDVSLTGTISASSEVQLNVIDANVNVCVSALYPITASVALISSVDVDMSGFVYGLSASRSVDILVSVDKTGAVFPEAPGFLTITPIYTLEIAGQVDQNVNATYALTASATGSVAAFLSVQATYPASISASAVLSTQDLTEVSVSALYPISISAQVLLVISQGNVEKNVSLVYGITASVVPDLLTPSPGGLVWSTKKQRYIAVRVGV